MFVHLHNADAGISCVCACYCNFSTVCSVYALTHMYAPTAYSAWLFLELLLLTLANCEMADSAASKKRAEKKASFYVVLFISLIIGVFVEGILFNISPFLFIHHWTFSRCPYCVVNQKIFVGFYLASV